MTKNELDKFYSELESNLRNYKRPADWLTRFERLKNKLYKPVRFQTHEKKRESYYE